MAEEGKITMTEFKTVVERFEDNQKKIVEVMNHRFDQVGNDISEIKNNITLINGNVDSLRHEVALLHEGQTAIRADLRKKVSYEDFEMLEKRVTRLENKVA